MIWFLNKCGSCANLNGDWDISVSLYTTSEGTILEEYLIFTKSTRNMLIKLGLKPKAFGILL